MIKLITENTSNTINANNNSNKISYKPINEV